MVALEGAVLLAVLYPVCLLQVLHDHSTPQCAREPPSRSLGLSDCLLAVVTDASGETAVLAGVAATTIGGDASWFNSPLELLSRMTASLLLLEAWN